MCLLSSHTKPISKVSGPLQENLCAKSNHFNRYTHWSTEKENDWFFKMNSGTPTKQGTFVHKLEKFGEGWSNKQVEKLVIPDKAINTHTKIPQDFPTGCDGLNNQ